MGEIYIALLLAVLFSIIIFYIQIRSEIDASSGFLFYRSTIIYLTILLIGNIASTFIASTVIDGFIEQRNIQNFFSDYSWFWYAFLGVFGFEVFIQNLNITFSEKGVLTISDWINKAKDNAVADIIERKTLERNRLIQELTDRLQTLEERELNTHIIQTLGDDKLQELQSIIDRNEDINPRRVKAWALASEAYNYAKGIA